MRRKVTVAGSQIFEYPQKFSFALSTKGHEKSSDQIGAFFGAFNQDRTGDLILTMDALYLLSYKGR